jgi:hypothetical protein
MFVKLCRKDNQETVGFSKDGNVNTIDLSKEFVFVACYCGICAVSKLPVESEDAIQRRTRSTKEATQRRALPQVPRDRYRRESKDEKSLYLS